ncbi:MAG: helix-turn-helix domain-containing protein [Clostridia bacterium]|nr:helix-turn-helix domain-containing protein [Clostridia bacterium]
MNIGEAIKYQREINGFTQSAVSKATGISQPKLSYFESGKHLPLIDDCIRLADFYGITIDELIGREIVGNHK